MSWQQEYCRGLVGGDPVKREYGLYDSFDQFLAGVLADNRSFVVDSSPDTSNQLRDVVEDVG